MTNNCELPTLNTTSSHADILKYGAVPICSAVYRTFRYLQTAFYVTAVVVNGTIYSSYLWISIATTTTTNNNNNNVVFLLVYAWYTQLDYGKL
jgi:hypothetical protein